MHIEFREIGKTVSASVSVDGGLASCEPREHESQVNVVEAGGAVVFVATYLEPEIIQGFIKRSWIDEIPPKWVREAIIDHHAEESAKARDANMKLENLMRNVSIHVPELLPPIEQLNEAFGLASVEILNSRTGEVVAAWERPSKRAGR